MSDEALAEIRHVAGTVSRETLGRLQHFADEFRRWNRQINLAAPSTLDSLWERHILDSVQIAPLVPDVLRWLDLGSGGGFPGAVMAILLMERPGACIEMVESNQKKAAFLRTTLGAMGAPAKVHVMRIEDAAGKVEMPEVVTARALAPLPQLLELASPWLGAGARGLFHKGRDYAREVAESHDGWRFDLIEHASRIDPASTILEIANLEPRTARP